MASSPRITTAPVDDDSVDFSPWIVVSNFVELRIEARARVSLERQSPAAVPMAPPQLMSYFYRRTFPSTEHVDSAIGEPFRFTMQDSAWEEETQSAFVEAMADYLLPDQGVVLAQVFCSYISSVSPYLARTDAVMVEISSLILVSDGSSPVGHLQLALPWEEFVLLDADDFDEADDFDSGGRHRPASAAAVEALKTVRVTEGGSCSICLEDLETAAPALIMPCSHAFHETCLREWLGRSHSCPLCRFLLPEAE